MASSPFIILFLFLSSLSSIPHSQSKLTTDYYDKHAQTMNKSCKKEIITGGHIIGFSHCKEFIDRIFSYSKKSESDPDLNPKFAQGLRKICANYKKDEAMSAFNDEMTPSKFDNMYYQNLPRVLGLLTSDNALFRDPRTKPFVEFYAENQTAFLKASSHAMEKLSVYGIKNGTKGDLQVRRLYRNLGMVD